MREVIKEIMYVTHDVNKISLNTIYFNVSKYFIFQLSKYSYYS